MPALQLGAVMLELVFCRFAISSVKQMLKHFGAGSIKAEQSRLIASKRLSELIQLCWLQLNVLKYITLPNQSQLKLVQQPLQRQHMHCEEQLKAADVVPVSICRNHKA